MSMADASFQERLARINAGQSYVAEGLLANGELHKIRKRQEKGKAPKPVATMGVQEKKKFPFKRLIISFLMGIFAFFGGSLGAFHATQSVPSEFDQYRPLVEALGPLGMSGVLAFFMFYVSGFRSVWLVGTIVAGLSAASFAEPHLARAAPDLWTQMYSADYADAKKFEAFAQATRWGLAPPPELAAPEAD
ncbi:hypothetical protein [Litoreibacter arenae]|uniref:Uncharacterized protein n=1 Tax=Litoreibacter arenae DSM 19593 TaxID=1123360 RepID=S9QHP5_9RHOB|nr:hypothetical protein [Litoreibacter arenae]EPX79068.1 hypothetical protein thalar_01886 [Litoreibacter arenae DSM 19593]